MRALAMVGGLLLACVGLWIVTWAGALASIRAEFPSLWYDTYTHSTAAARRHQRHHWVFTGAWAAMPPAWFIGPMVTGGYQDGFLWPWEPYEDAR